MYNYLITVKFFLQFYLNIRFEIRSMGKFKYIIVVFILFSLTGHCFKLPETAPTFAFSNVKKSTSLTASQAHDDLVNQIKVFKRKNKSKGLLVIVPHVPKLYFSEVYIYHDFFAQKTTNNYSCSLHYVQLKRGPPVLQKLSSTC